MSRHIAVFASGSGTNAENLVRYFSRHPAGKVVVILSNSRQAQVHERARQWGVPSFVFTRGEFDNGAPVLAKLAEYHVDFIALAGFLCKVSAPLLCAFPRQIVNIHPALLPKYGGKEMYGMRVHEAVIAAGEQESGITIHYVNEDYDRGAILFQATCPVLPDDTPDALAARVHALEYAHYPQAIEKLLQG